MVRLYLLAAAVLGALMLGGAGAQVALAYTNSFDGGTIIPSSPYTYTSMTYYSIDHRNPSFRWAVDTDHSTGVRWIRTNGVAASDYADIAAHDTSYHDPPNGYIPYYATFWARVYSQYSGGTRCPNSNCIGYILS